jgi:small conductance mechanosensitive channel
MSFWQRFIHEHPLEVVFSQGLKVITIVVGALVISFLANRALRRLERRAEAAQATRLVEARRAVTTVGLAGSVVRWAIFVIAALMVLGEVGIKATPILAGAGIVGLAVGFGAQSLVRDIVSGFFIILEGQLAVGDKAEINGVYGVVEEIGLRTTRVIAPGGQVRYFGNGSITGIVRYPAGAAPYVITVPVQADKPDEARAAILNILADYDAEQNLFAAPPGLRDVLDLPTYGRVIRLTARVLPAARAGFEAKAAARIGALLAERGFPIPQGREVTVQADPAVEQHRVGQEP